MPGDSGRKRTAFRRRFLLRRKKEQIENPGTDIGGMIAEE